MGTFMDLTGKRFGKWLVLSISDKRQRLWLCRCDCGTEKIVDGSSLKSGTSKSCRCPTYPYRNPVASVWSGMKTRCYNTKDPQYKNWGGRGIKMSILWKNDLKAFIDWAASSGYKKGLSIERKDNNRGYSPENCCWATQQEQCYNQRITIRVVWEGEEIALQKLCRLKNLPFQRIAKRISKGWSAYEAITASKYKQKDSEKRKQRISETMKKVWAKKRGEI